MAARNIRPIAPALSEYDNLSAEHERLPTLDFFDDGGGRPDLSAKRAEEPFVPWSERL